MLHDFIVDFDRHPWPAGTKHYVEWDDVLKHHRVKATARHGGDTYGLAFAVTRTLGLQTQPIVDRYLKHLSVSMCFTRDQLALGRSFDDISRDPCAAPKKELGMPVVYDNG